MPNEKQQCYCESSMCDHDGECSRAASEHVGMEYVGKCCDTCAANMCATGGESYIYLNEQVSV